jgi:aryl-alcohol dehydrogenase-like predicted oxidoreductase
MTWGEQNTEEEAYDQLDYALSKGVNFVDTAELYPVPPNADTVGRTETYIGRWLASRQCRDKIILATKVMGRGATNPGRNHVVANRTDPPNEDAPPARLVKDQIHAAVAGSLRRLQTDYIDLIQLHWPDRYVPAWGNQQYNPTKEWEATDMEEQVAAVGELIKQGKIKYWGVSNETTFGVCQLSAVADKLGVSRPISIQNDFSLLDRRFESELAEACAPNNLNISLLPYGPLAGGTLTDKYFSQVVPVPGTSRHVKYPNFQPRYHSERSKAAAAEYAAIAAKVGISTAALALAWCQSRWYVGSTIIGATTMEQLKENIEAFELDLDEETLKAIDAVHVDKYRNPNVTD